MLFPCSQENVYGSQNRINWVRRFLSKTDKVLDLGCGTGSMLTIPLIAQGYDVIGLDLDGKSIDYGKGLLNHHGLDEGRLRCCSFSDIDFSPNVVVASQVSLERAIGCGEISGVRGTGDDDVSIPVQSDAVLGG